MREGPTRNLLRASIYRSIRLKNDHCVHASNCDSKGTIQLPASQMRRELPFVIPHRDASLVEDASKLVGQWQIFMGIAYERTTVRLRRSLKCAGGFFSHCDFPFEDDCVPVPARVAPSVLCGSSTNCRRAAWNRQSSPGPLRREAKMPVPVGKSTDPVLNSAQTSLQVVFARSRAPSRTGGG